MHGAEVSQEVSYLVRVFEDCIFPLRLLQTGIDDCTQHTPGIADIQRHLLSQFCRLDLLNT